jgi:hypothetical protein
MSLWNVQFKHWPKARKSSVHDLLLNCQFCVELMIVQCEVWDILLLFQLKGLCGNYNDNQLDDFQTPSGGLSEVSARLFGDSWRLQSYCPESVDVVVSVLLYFQIYQ